MTVYRVLSASTYRGRCFLGVEAVERDDRIGHVFEIENQPEKAIRLRAGRIVFEGEGPWNKRVFVIEPPAFPVEELVGQRILCG